jgi:alpha-beta hydrolase superfamily lysophospholipase
MVACEPICLRYSDHYEAFARWWMPPAVCGGVLYLHGIQSHGHWFERSGRRLAEAGLAVLLPDRRGSGRNELARGHASSARRLIRDALEGMDEMHVRTGLNRFHLVGVSWGGKLALALLKHAPDRIETVTLVAPGLFPMVDLRFRQKLSVGVSAIAARHRAFDIPLNDPDLFTANVERRRFIASDPLALHRVTAAFLVASRELDHRVQAVARTAVECPLHLILAGQDRIIDNGRTRRFIESLTARSVTVTDHPEAHHTLEFEVAPEAYFADLVDWIRQRVPGRTELTRTP